ncbi:integrase [Sporosarcina obsidiansis]|uniref:integrase n=1 Tax=Sporosarcina obsidiansis TaxID=2660748 RepID=UPI00129B0889|nr:integrase [Sporosarcina obsidiansis]
MKEQLQTKDFSQLIADVMESVEMNVPLREVFDGINMSYNFIGKYIGFDAQRLQVSHMEMAPFCSFETYVQTITMHELGHVLDHEALDASLAKTVDIFTMKKSHTMKEIFSSVELMNLLIEEDEMNIAFEITAWENASQLNDRYQLIDKECFELIRKNSLATYEKVYEEDLKYYRMLLQKSITSVA